MQRDIFFLKYLREKEQSFREIILSQEALEQVPSIAGVYVFTSTDKTKFIYPNGQSPVYYIGESNDLNDRLSQHYRALCDLINNKKKYLAENIQFTSRYHYMDAFGAKVYLIPCKGMQSSKKLESIVMNMFYQRYHAIPVGNGARSFWENK